MVRIGSTAAAAAAVLALAACGSIHGSSPWTGGSGAVIDDELFPPPPPVPAVPAETGEQKASEIASLRASLTRLSADIDESRRHLARLEAEVESTRTRLDRLLAEQDSFKAGGTPAAVPARPDRRPLVRIRYDDPDVAYEDALVDAVALTLARLPGAAFDLVAVTPAAANGGPATARLHADEVEASLLAMGVEPDRISLAAAMSDAVAIDEVHLYIR